MRPGVGVVVPLVLALAVGAGAAESIVDGVDQHATLEPDSAGHLVAPAWDAASASASPAAPAGANGRSLARGDILEVVAAEIPLRRDALSLGGLVGRLHRGERVLYLDAIDRRLRVFNVTLFDGGYWVRVRAADGSEGWLRADTVREVR